MNAPANPPIAPVPDPPTAPQTRGIVLRRAAAVYDVLSPVMMLWTTTRINRRAVKSLDIQPGDCVLDVGCATGEATLFGAAQIDSLRGGLAVGLDASPEMVARARHKVRDHPCRFDIGAAERLPYADAVFDKAVTTFFFHHLDLADKLSALKEIHRVLKPGGILVVTDVGPPTNALGRFAVRVSLYLFHQSELEENVRGMLVPLFESAGFSHVEHVAEDLGFLATFLMRKV